MRALTGLVGATVEAWSELRVHRGRVMLSLIGVALAVAALTGVVALGGIAQQALTESFERQSGRPAMLSVEAPSDPMTGAPSGDRSEFDAAFTQAMDRYGIDFWSRVQYSSIGMRLPDGAVEAGGMVVDPDWGVMHRTSMLEGEWFTDADADRLAPAIIIDEGTWKRMGSPALETHPTLPLTGTLDTTAVVTGVVAAQCPECYTGYLLADSYGRLSSPVPETDTLDGGYYVSPSSFEAWVPPEIAQDLADRLTVELQAAAGEGTAVYVNRSDYLAYGGQNPLAPIQLGVGGVAALVLFLGALSLVNISLVTVRTRIREIGIRRSFGATAGRVFFGVMMESVVATVAAGVVGVAIAVFVLKSPWVSQLILNQGVQDLPPFPVSAAITGLVASAVVGALAGLIPALVAVRVKPIDAIRY